MIVQIPTENSIGKSKDCDSEISSDRKEKVIQK
jgi:hypothetical protein